MKTGFFTKNNGWLSIALILAAAITVLAQTTEFTYQGKLNDGGTPVININIAVVNEYFFIDFNNKWVYTVCQSAPFDFT